MAAVYPQSRTGLQSSVKGLHWPTMDPAIEAVLADYEARQQAEDVLISEMSPEQVGRQRDEFLLSVGRPTGVFLNVLVRESRARRILELGTSNGYSTIWLAEAARATGGQVFTVDVVSEKQQHARRALQRTGLSDYVRFYVADALNYLHSSDETYDFVLIDVWKDRYIACADALVSRLNPGATIIADNMLEPKTARMAAARYQAHLSRNPDFQTILLPVGSGLAVTRYLSGSPRSSR